MNFIDRSDCCNAPVKALMNDYECQECKEICELKRLNRDEEEDQNEKSK